MSVAEGEAEDLDLADERQVHLAVGVHARDPGEIILAEDGDPEAVRDGDGVEQGLAGIGLERGVLTPDRAGGETEQEAQGQPPRGGISGQGVHRVTSGRKGKG